MPVRLLRNRADTRGLFEALAANATTDDDWVAGFVDASREVFALNSVGCQWVKHDGTFDHIEIKNVGHSWSPEIVHQFAQQFEPGGFERMFLEVYTQENALVDPFDTFARAGLRREAVTEQLGFVQTCGVPVAPMPGIHVAFIWASYDQVFTVTPEDLRVLRRIALHFENGVRLRTCQLQAGEVTLDGASDTVEPSKLWESLCAGGVSLVKRGLGYRILPTPPSRRFSRSLRHAERQALEQCAHGRPFKEIAWHLDVSPSRLSTIINSAAAKLGIPSTVDALRLIGGLLRQSAPLASLTEAERDVLSLIKTGLTNKDIALARQRSERTVANQVASLLRKTGLSGRRALISLMAAGER